MRRLTITVRTEPSPGDAGTGTARAAAGPGEILLISGVLNGSSLGQLRRAVDAARGELFRGDLAKTEAARSEFVGSTSAPGEGAPARQLSPSAVRLDLSELVLADRAALEYLARLRSEQVELLNVPEYIRRWIDPSEFPADGESPD